jgi:pSer/pThr/pTyr-binding forkhead associated (FHA) protein
MRTVTIGTDPACDIVIDDPYASGRHCVLIQDGAEDHDWFVRDLGSTNGTGVLRPSTDRSVRLKAGGLAQLAAGDVLIVGRTRMPPFTPERVTG